MRQHTYEDFPVNSASGLTVRQNRDWSDPRIVVGESVEILAVYDIWNHGFRQTAINSFSIKIAGSVSAVIALGYGWEAGEARLREMKLSPPSGIVAFIPLSETAQIAAQDRRTLYIFGVMSRVHPRAAEHPNRAGSGDRISVELVSLSGDTHTPTKLVPPLQGPTHVLRKSRP